MNNLTEQVYSFIKTAEKFLVVSHTSPDGDAIGSLLAFSGILEQFGKDYELAIDDACPSKYSFMPGFDKIRNLKLDPLTEIFPNLVVLDAGSMERIGSAQSCIDENTTILNIDHHFTGEYYGNVNMVESEECATSAIIYDLCQRFEIDISPQIAYGIYVGILTDTGRFRYSNTDSKALKICGDLVSKGVDAGMVVEKLFFNMSTNVVSSIAWGLSNLKILCDGLVSIIHLDHEHYVPDSENLIDFGLSINGVVISALISEMEPNEFKVSLRSRCDVDVSNVAKQFGGGGHRKASGLRANGTFEEIKTSLLEKFESEIGKANVTTDVASERVEHVSDIENSDNHSGDN